MADLFDRLFPEPESGVEVLIDARHVGDDGIPRDVHQRPKPWGSGEQDGDFRIESKGKG